MVTKGVLCMFTAYQVPGGSAFNNALQSQGPEGYS